MAMLPGWMVSPSPNLEMVTNALNGYAGRDKIVRTLGFACSLQAQQKTPENAAPWQALAKQCFAARRVFRQFNHPVMIKACRGLLIKPPDDKLDAVCAYTTTGAYTIYGFVELMAWLADAKIITADAAKLFRYCLYLWFIALLSGIIKQLNALRKKGLESLEKIKDDLLLLISYLCDFATAGNAMPVGYFWSGQLPPSISDRLSLIASVIGFYRTL